MKLELEGVELAENGYEIGSLVPRAISRFSYSLISGGETAETFNRLGEGALWLRVSHCRSFPQWQAAALYIGLVSLRNLKLFGFRRGLQTALSRGKIIFAYTRRATLSTLQKETHTPSERDVHSVRICICSFYNYERRRDWEDGWALYEWKRKGRERLYASFEASTKQCLWQVGVQTVGATSSQSPWGWMVSHTTDMHFLL